MTAPVRRSFTPTDIALVAVFAALIAVLSLTPAITIAGPVPITLQTLGVAGVADKRELLSRMPARVAPRVCDVGAMQTPPLHALHDGLPAWEGLLRWAEV